MGNILSQIVESKKAEVEQRRRRQSVADLQARIADLPRPRNLYAALMGLPRWQVHLIAEIKKASPSAGLLRANFDPVAIAQTYHECGASAVSVVTDETYFSGSLEHIEQVKTAMPLPVLRKDFLIDEYQVYESRAAGADAILLIAEILEPSRLMDMLILANELNLTALIEVHEADALMRFRSLVGFPLKGYSLLGINNRNLRTEVVDVGTTIRLMGMLDDDVPVVSESGITTRQDVEKLARAGVRGLLVGETLMRADDIAAKIAELFQN
ncbi:MAG: indole-3-glycerol phosphate synthase TrpC [Phycisphaerales bacterium]|nr:MAG: indole-3-glycerol phosphate synthase TrpC [Phycisphaerales bacterium]